MISIYRYWQTKKLLVEQEKTVDWLMQFWRLGEPVQQMAQVEITKLELEYHKARILPEVILFLLCVGLGVILYFLPHWKLI